MLIRPQDNVERMMLGLQVLLICLLLFVLGWMGYQMLMPGGANDSAKIKKSQMMLAYENGQHAEFIRLYETPFATRFGPDIFGIDLSYEDMFKIAESYLMVGNLDEARERFLAILGWDVIQFDSYCLLTGTDCQDLHALRLLADSKRSEAH